MSMTTRITATELEGIRQLPGSDAILDLCKQIPAYSVPALIHAAAPSVFAGSKRYVEHRERAMIALAAGMAVMDVIDEGQFTLSFPGHDHEVHAAWEDDPDDGRPTIRIESTGTPAIWFSPPAVRPSNNERAAAANARETLRSLNGSLLHAIAGVSLSARSTYQHPANFMRSALVEAAAALVGGAQLQRRARENPDEHPITIYSGYRNNAGIVSGRMETVQPKQRRKRGMTR